MNQHSSFIKPWPNEGKNPNNSGIYIWPGGIATVSFTKTTGIFPFEHTEQRKRDFPALDSALNFIVNDLKLPLDYGKR